MDSMGRLSLIVIFYSFLMVLAVGLLAGKGPMVADEVVHYYMLVTQADKLPQGNIVAQIPMNGWTYNRFYPHVFLWHYMGAAIWRLLGRSFAVVQVYQSVFWLQLLLAVWFTIKKELQIVRMA